MHIRPSLGLPTTEGVDHGPGDAIVGKATVDLWLSRYASDGIAGLLDHKRGAGREQVPARIRARILAATRITPPDGLSHRSSREMAG